MFFIYVESFPYKLTGYKKNSSNQTYDPNAIGEAE